ncbi:hypothetical protein TI05_19210, partial [Achromatium sp. WMS3]
AKALDNHLPEETDNWHQELVALSRNSLGPLISPLCAPALARIAIAGKHWYEIPCKWCDEKVIYHVALFLCANKKFTSAHRLAMQIDSYQARHHIGLEIIKGKPHDMKYYKMAFKTLGQYPTAKDLLQYSKDFARTYLDLGQDSLALGLHGPEFWDMFRGKGKAFMEADPWPHDKLLFHRTIYMVSRTSVFQL